jgi:hypothetical protein
VPTVPKLTGKAIALRASIGLAEAHEWLAAEAPPLRQILHPAQLDRPPEAREPFVSLV